MFVGMGARAWRRKGCRWRRTGGKMDNSMVADGTG